MNESSPCPTCGKPIPADAPMGVCPKCLIAVTGDTRPEGDAAPARSFDPPAPAELAEKFPQLEILELIGRGGMGAVYKARQKDLDRVVALKILPPGFGGEEPFADRFAREAKSLAKLNHPNIVTLYEFGNAGGLYFFLMEYVDGVNLRQAMSAGRFTPEEALAIVPPVCEALQFAHENGVVHRDIKPENLLLDRDGNVKIADFGVAKVVGLGGAGPPGETPREGESSSEDGSDKPSLAAGTPRYMAPEQTDDPAHADHRVDIYAMGVVLYELLTGEMPQGDIAPPSKRVEVDVRIDEIVLRALEKEPELRFPTAAEFRTQVETVVSARHDGGATEEVPSSGWLSPKNWWLPALVAYALNSLCAILVYVEEAGDFDSLFGELFVLTMIFDLIAFSFLVFTCWRALPEKYRATSPYKAIGFLFIPFFNFYWAFVAYGKLAEGFVRYGKDRRDARMRDARPLAMWYAIAFVFWFVIGVFGEDWPLAGVVFYLVDLALFVLFFRAMVANAVCVQDGPGSEDAVDRLQGWVALGFAGLSGILGAAALVQMPDPPEALLWSILAASLTGLVLAFPVRRINPGKRGFAGAIANIVLWVLIAITFAFLGQPRFKNARVIEHEREAMEHAWKIMQLKPGDAKWEKEYRERRDALVERGHLQKRVFNIAAPIGSAECDALIQALMARAGSEPVCSWSPGEFSTQVTVWATPEEIPEWEALLSKWKWMNAHPLEVTKAGGLDDLGASVSGGFGSETRRTLPLMEGEGEYFFIDFDTGDSVGSDHALENLSEERLTQWLERRGADAAAVMVPENSRVHQNAHIPFLTGRYCGTVFAPLMKGDFETARASEAAQALKATENPDISWDRTDGWNPSWFRTRQGQVGLVQMLGIDENKRQARFRYKLAPSITVEAPPDVEVLRSGRSRRPEQTKTSGSKVQRFVPEPGLEAKTNWMVMDKPSELNPQGWFVMAHIALGGVAKPQLRDESKPILLKLTEGDHETVTIEVTDQVRETTMTFELARDRPARMMLNGKGYELLYPTVDVAAGQSDTRSLAMITMKPAETESAKKPALKRQRFAPEPGMEKDTNWGLYEKPSPLNPDGWAFYARMTLGGTAWMEFAGEKERRAEFTLVEGDDAGITLEIKDLKRNSTVRLSLIRNRPGEVTIDGEGYRVLYMEVSAGPDDADTSPFAHVVVTPAGQPQPGQPSHQ